MGEVNRKVSEYESRITMLSQEIERLNGNLRSKVDENSQLENNNRFLLQDIENQKRRLSEYEITVTQEWQSKLLRYTQELDESKYKSSRYIQENEDLRHRLNELNEANRRLSEY